MALRTAWWMQTLPNPASQSQTQPATANTPNQPHQTWPKNLNTTGISFAVLEETLRKSRATACRIEKLRFVPGLSADGKHARWTPCTTVNSNNDLIALIQEADPQDVHSVFFEAIQILGYYLDLTPRFFNFPYTLLSTGNAVEQYVFFSLQLFERYEGKRVPAEATRSDASPTARFRAATGMHGHTWHVTRIALLFARSLDRKKFRGLVHLDPLDTTIAEGLQKLMTRDEQIPPGEAEAYAGLGQILSEVMYITTFNWGVFLAEAELHLQILSQKCIDEDLDIDAQLMYTRELHQLSPLWVQVRRRLVCVKDLAGQMLVHPFFADINGHNGRVAIEGYLTKQVNMVEDHITRTKELEEQTGVLISLIFNIATLQDTRAAVEEGKLANAFTASIRRVTLLTFVYLPLMLAASIFGMNLREMTGDRDSLLPSIWWYFIIAALLMLATFIAWFFWSRLCIA
ncbi:uncharacterized protein CC84DRAFT_1228289 [Paraphaeosphaeria sporulosa]|uniref:Mg2+ transporter protein n=1 Tax=Paraphaeosphaeria sporulosa TaxID=1460663 RepID=A0A177C3R9_9PLEO|nr:uncharacterized protein CC84DRAFT_1228289 [Paraphaeosphaeria sporulosa]OAG01310.1 hypothetical protein CC84DRAFT_1228289 [Paraphaeosphaeria sporulosa]